MKHYKRGFLNRDEGFAAFECNVTYEPEYRHNSVYADFSLRDCNRQINLEFSCYDDNDYDKAVFKLNALMAELAEFKQCLAVAKAEYDEAQLKFAEEQLDDQA
jgi:hypothetical protein